MALVKPPIFVGSFSQEEREALEEAGLRSKDAFVLRRCQMLLAGSRGESPPKKIARGLGCGSRTLSNAVHGFDERGLHALAPGSSRPKRTRAAFVRRRGERRAVAGAFAPLPEGVRQGQRVACGRSRWPAAEVAFEEGLTQRQVSGETIRATLARLLGVRWQRAKRLSRLWPCLP